MKSKDEQLKNRGFIEDEVLADYKDYTKDQLLVLLHSKVPCDRTISARLLVKYDDNDVLTALIDRLVIEKKLYPKIAMSEGISSYGKKASYLLVDYLGMIGKNQHTELPDKPFKKKNYPLPRDIIARTICKIGKSALEALKECLNNGSYVQKLEAIDAVGFISYYEHDESLLDDILSLMRMYREDDLMIWKLLRALQAFDGDVVLEELRNYQNSNIPQHVWESTRSIEQIIRRK